MAKGALPAKALAETGTFPEGRERACPPKPRRGEDGPPEPPPDPYLGGAPKKWMPARMHARKSSTWYRSFGLCAFSPGA